jgi:hypothetical protein
MIFSLLYEKLISAKRSQMDMPKTYPKIQPKKTKPTKNKYKDQPKSFSLLKSKFYWITLTVIMLVFSVACGYLIGISLDKEIMIVGSILAVIGFAFYVGYRSPASYDKRATFIFAGASIIGFSIWAAIVLSFNATGINSKIESSIGIDLFAVTSLIICLISGAFIGDLMGKNKEALSSVINKFRN